MFPMAEMAGWDRIKFIPETLYIYHYETSFEARASAGELEEERSIAGYFRSKTPYERLESL